MTIYRDGPASPLFRPVTLEGSLSFEELALHKDVSAELAQAVPFAHSGACVAWGIPFEIERPIFLHDQRTTIRIASTLARWFVFLHASDIRPLSADRKGLISPMRGIGQLGEHAANYVLIYDDGSEEKVEIRRRHQVGSFLQRWGEQCTEAVPAIKPRSLSFKGSGQWDSKRNTAGLHNPVAWGLRQLQLVFEDNGRWINSVWALENPNPGKAVVGLRFEPVSGSLIVSGLSVGNNRSMPLRWRTRAKVLLRDFPHVGSEPAFEEHTLLDQIQLDLGQVIAAHPRLVYPSEEWEGTRQNLQPNIAFNEVLVEYAAHEDAEFHLAGDIRAALRNLESTCSRNGVALEVVKPADQRVSLRVVEKGTNTAIPVKLHVHGMMGEYLAPVDRSRNPNPQWFENYSPDLCHGTHTSTYISGHTTIDLPLGNVFIEITKGFEITPVRKTVEVTRDTTEITLEIEKALHWREQGWVTADTHVHFLSPATAMLEGAAEGVNVINLLASQWGELMTNVGDFDGHTTFGTRAAGGTGEYLVRVGTENRQHVLGHISLLGYSGNMITPLCSGGADESAIGDPVDVLLTEWAQKCRKQGGLVVLPHFPDPRLENAATIVLGEADAVEMTSYSNLYSGIDAYSLADWYRYLNNGYLIPAVAGTDKMSAQYAVGTIRTYAKITDNREFSYETWMDAVRAGHTFVTSGPLMDIDVDGKPMGSRFGLSSSGGTVTVSWNAASVIVPMTRIDLVVNGEVKESRTLKPWQDAGSWSVRIQKSSWIALLVRAKYDDKPEMIATHSSPVMIDVEGSHFFAAADALTILEQIEGSMAYIDTIGTRAETTRYKEMRLVLQSAYRRLHDQMHQMGYDHPHSVGTHHSEHD
ncbi:CehA/McbA family metallohydrolase [Mesorhizobium shangrilense]|uniref:CehA/McbA family metallohydrolase n=1 Tax=Mesorhizobium shangrilense TaxID=460060 RepID=A0ABV2DSA4_9HYPH